MVWYNRARSKVKKNDIEGGLEDLESAVAIDKEEYMGLAKRDKDFKKIKKNKRFKELIA